MLQGLPSGSVHMCATSPPFFGLRDYQTEGQIGLEETPDEWVASLVAVFREVRRVLRDDGTLWVEIGDSYNAHPGGGGDRGGRALNVLQGTGEQPQYESGHGLGRTKTCKPKDLLGQPWLLAFALRADGWYLRSEIIWARPNPMPESVTDRPTKSHSTVFLLSKRPRYFFDADAIREAFQTDPATNRGNFRTRTGESVYLHTDPRGMVNHRPTLDGSPGESPRGPDGRRTTTVKGTDASVQHRDGERWPNPTGANARSVWQIATEPTPFAHFATWPQALVRRMILAGTSERGACPECGAPWVRETGRDVQPQAYPAVKYDPDDPMFQTKRNMGARYQAQLDAHPKRTLGWSPSCGCIPDGFLDADSWGYVPCTVLDPFAGSGTTSLVARNHGRHSIGIELNESYLEIAAKRLQQLSLLTETGA